MRSLAIPLSLAGLILALRAVDAAPDSRASGAIFPAVTGRDLLGQRRVLPKDFLGKYNLVFVAFKRQQQSDVDSWQPFVNAATARDSELRAYEVPTLPSTASFFRGFIDNGMKRGVRTAEKQRTTITLYIDKAPFEKSLGIASEASISVFLVRPDGTVLWHTTGPYARASEPDLRALTAR